MDEVNELDFTLELTSEHLNKDQELELFTTAEDRLLDLADGHTDMTGAAIMLRAPAHGETTPIHTANVVVYARPEHVNATEKAGDPFIALDNALDAVERQIRERREKLKKRWEQPGNLPIEQEIMEINLAEESEI